MNYQSNELNVLFSSDDNYAQHLGAAIYSLLYHNKDFKTISIYIIDNEISSRNRRNLEQVVEEFHYAKIAFLDFTAWKSKLHLNLAWEISLTAYARLFVAELLPMSVQRVLYLDCDMIICDDLYELWNTDLNRNMLGAVQDFVSENTKTCVGLDANDVYLNSGMLLIDLSQWRDNQIGKECLDYLNIKHGTVCHHDQGVLNGVFRSQWAIMPLRYNVMTIHYIFSSLQILMNEILKEYGLEIKKIKINNSNNNFKKDDSGKKKNFNSNIEILINFNTFIKFFPMHTSKFIRS